MKLVHRAKSLIRALAICTVLLTVAAPVLAGNDFIQGELRVDRYEVYTACDYQTLLYAGEGSNAPFPWFTCAWLSVHLTSESEGFTQVGILTDQTGVYWFAYSYLPVTILRGWPKWPGHGCQGIPNDIVQLGRWHRVELVRRYYAPDWKWVARIYDTYGNGYDLAIIHSGSNRIYKALCVTEEAYPDPADPFWTAKFYHYHPQYKSGGTWYDWPASSGTNVNKITTTEGTCPAHYGALPYLGGDPRYWYAGTAGSNQYWCQVNPLFPASTTYLPDIKANYGGWNSFIAIRNNGSQTAAVQVAFYDSNGNHVADKVKENLSARGTWILPATDAGLNNWRGSAVVYASEDVGVVVNNHGPNNTNYSYSAAGPQGTTLYLPSTHRNDWGWYSDIAVQNVGTTAANVRLTFRNAGGTYKHQVTANNVPPGATRFFPTASYGQLGSYYGPAVLAACRRTP